MCGIAGFVRFDRPLDPVADGALLERMAAVIAHRGPDDEQIRIRDNVGFAFRRLSIVDLDGGEQPMASADGRLMQMTNGEIYNHADLRASLLAKDVVRGSSDCAVVLPLYEKLGPDYLRHLNGIFATALLDRRKKRLFLSRDHLGVKPLYYYRSRELFVFASEVKGVLAHPEVPRRFDWKSALVGRPMMRASFAEDRGLTSYFEEIVHLPGGHQVEVDLVTGEVTDRAYWDPMAEAARIYTGALDRQPYIDRYAELLEGSVRRQLMSDVEYGLFLSGGIDSVSIASLAAKESAPFHTFTVLGQSTITNGDARAAHTAARELGLPNHQVFYDWRKPPWTAADWRRVVWMCEMPNADAGMLYKLTLHGFARDARPDLKVMLLGEGSDEFNGGYTRDLGKLGGDQGTWEQVQHVLREVELRAYLTSTQGANPFAEMTTLEEARSGRRAHVGPITTDFWARQAGQDALRHPFEAYWNAHLSSMQMSQLWREDRQASAHGIENRVPFLDPRIVEHLMSIPPALYEDLFWDKRVLRDAMKGRIPEALREREKVPFFLGEDRRYTNRLVYQLLCEGGRGLLEEAFAGADLGGPVFDKDVFLRLFDDAPNDPEYASVPALTELVNMGLLASMARDPAAEKGTGRATSRLAEIRMDDWDAWHGATGVDLVRRENGPELGAVVEFSEDILLVRCHNGDPGWMDRGSYYVLRNDKLLFLIDAGLDGWIRFLNAIDGEATVGAILEAEKIERGAVWKHLEEAVEHDVLRIRRAA